MSTSPSQAFQAVVRYLAGWRAIALLVATAATFLVAWLASDGSLSIALGATGIVLLVFATLTPMLALEADRIGSWSTKQARVADLAAGTNRQVGLLDAIVADTTRAWAEPTALPWPTDDGSRPVLLLPGAAYHLAEIIPLARELDRRGIPARIAVGEAHWERVRQGLVDYTGEVFALPSPATIVAGISALATMKDWAGYRPYVEAAQDGGLPTFAKVEGAQDFEEVDTGKDFRPYRTADHILCQGANDVAALGGDRTVVGSTRLERLRLAPLRVPRRELAVINLNFSYGVLAEARNAFLESAIEACLAGGMPYVVAVHPAVHSYPKDPVYSTVPISRLLENASLLISRFSTVPFEAMARGVPFIYHNPHGERAPTFQDPRGAFRCTTSASDLGAAIEEARGWNTDYRDRSHDFFAAQVDIDTTRRSEQRAADVIERSL